MYYYGYGNNCCYPTYSPCQGYGGFGGYSNFGGFGACGWIAIILVIFLLLVLCGCHRNNNIL